jgi:hypothetical protein
MRRSFAGTGPGGRGRTVLAVIALLTAAAEIATAAFNYVPQAAAAVMAVLFVAGWLLLQVPSATGPILIGLASALEVLFTPLYGRNGASTWLVHGAIAVLGIVGVVAAYATLRADRDSRGLPPATEA